MTALSDLKAELQDLKRIRHKHRATLRTAITLNCRMGIRATTPEAMLSYAERIAGQAYDLQMISLWLIARGQPPSSKDAGMRYTHAI